jgi:uncharacterized protein
MIFADHLTLDAPRRLAGGYVAVRARAARTGVYDYTGREIDPENKQGLRDKAIVKVLRDEETVFDDKAARSFIGKPITDNHPAVPVTADNWRTHARGTVMGAMRDGDYLAFDLLLTDAAAIAAVDGGKRELSNGYAADLEFGRFTAPDGTVCDARQTSVTGNHVALVDRGRAGPECAIRDAALCDAITAQELTNLKTIIDEKEPRMAGTIIVDGLPVSLADEAAVRAVLDKKDAAITAANLAVTDATARAEKAEGEKAAMQTQLDEARAAIEPAKLDQLATDRAALIASAKAVVPALDAAGKTAADIRKEVVTAKLGDKAPATDAAIEGAFAVLAASPVSDNAVHNIAPVTPANNNARSVINALRDARIS